MEVTHYGGGWIGFTPVGPPLPRELRPKPVATYRATLPGNGAGSSLTFAAGIDQPELILALNQRPEYMPFAWPDRELRDAADLRTLTLVKILAVVSFGTRWSSLDPVDILAQSRSNDPDLAARTRPWLWVTGDIFPNGDATFGVEDIPDDDLPSPDILGTANDPFIRATVGADLIRLIRSENPSWDPFAVDAHRLG